MKGLLYKDFLIIKTQKSYLYIFVLAIIMTVFFKDNGIYLNTMMGLVFLMSGYSTFSFDESARWLPFAAAAPVSRRTIVGEKYLFSFLSAVAYILFGVLVSVFFYFAAGVNTFANTLLLNAAISGIYLTGLSFVLPLIFKKGIEKTRYFASGILIFPYFLFILGSTLFPELKNIPSILNPVALAGLLLAIGALCILVSLRVSFAIISKKDF